MSGKARLIEWACWRLEPMFHFPIQNPLERIKEDRENAGAGNERFHYDMQDGVPCMPDGGLGDMIDRMSGAIDRDRRCREVNELVNELRDRSRDFWNLVDVTFSGTHPRDVMKGPVVSAKIMGIGLDDYRTRIRAVYQWVEGRLTEGSSKQDKRYRRCA